jgi:hypothetical protein
MAIACFAKSLNALHPADDAAQEIMRSLGRGEIVDVTIRKPRNLQFHRKFFALMNLVWQNIDDHDTYPTVESLVTYYKIATGHRDEYHFQGAVAYIPRSISFAKMDNTEFSAFFNSVADWIAKEFIPGVTNDEVRHEVEGLIGMHS